MDATDVEIHQPIHGLVVDDGHHAVAGQVGGGVLDHVRIGAKDDDVVDAGAGTRGLGG